MMRSLSFLILLATLASAMPLRKGASLGYRVWRGWEKDTCLVTLTVGDSAVTDSGILWNVAIRDSLIGGDRIRNSVAVLRVANGDTVWQTPSCLAAWDPASRKTDSIDWSVSFVPGRLPFPLPYGALGPACTNLTSSGWLPNDSMSKLYAYTLRKENRRWEINNQIMFWHSGSLPSRDARQDTGMVRLDEQAIGERWNLVAIDGHKLGSPYDWPPPDTTPLGTLLVDLVPGKTWSWRHVGSGSSSGGGIMYRSVSESYGRRRMTILSVQSDTGGLLTCRMQTRTDDSTHGMPSGPISESWSTSSVVDTLAFQVDPRGGKVLLSGGTIPQRLFVSGLLGLNTDRPNGIGKFLRQQTDSAYDGILGNTIVKRTSSTITLREQIGATSIEYTDWSRSQPGEMFSSASSEKGYMELLSMDSLVLVSGGWAPYVWPGVAVRRLDRAWDRITSPNDLEKALSSHPAATVCITSVSGRSEILSGPEALRVLRARHGIVLLELRDGSTSIRGRMLLP